PPTAATSVARGRPALGPPYLNWARRAGDAFSQLRDKLAAFWHKLRRLLGPPLAATWGSATARFPKLALLEQPVSIGRLRVPLWGLCAACLATLTVTLFVILGSDEAPRSGGPTPLQSSRRTAPKVVEVTTATESRAVT